MTTLHTEGSSNTSNILSLWSLLLLLLLLLFSGVLTHVHYMGQESLVMYV